MNNMKCIKNLYKSTYKHNAFDKVKEYIIVNEDKEFIFVKDNSGYNFNFSKEKIAQYYYFNDYFTNGDK